MNQFDFHNNSKFLSSGNLTIIIQTVGLYKSWHEFLPHFTKDSRYSLGIKIDALIIEIAGLFFTASRLPKEQKLPYLQKSGLKLDSLKFLFQMAWEIKSLDNKKYIVISEKLDAIGKMLGGWTKQTEKQNSPNKN
ncbi:MAG: four helix bundle protein [Patescibacteria group bacterium]